MSKRKYYNGQGQQQAGGWKTLPEVDPEALRSAENYLASRDLAAAVDIALTLGMPLLLTGEPGSGKSRLAHSVAWELDMDEPFEFVVKSDTRGTDLFYSFDTVGRFHATQADKDIASSNPRNFVTFNALGRAILNTKGAEFIEQALKFPLKRIGHSGSPRRSVVLIDEIDKAPRDVPNDILAEIEGMQFRVPELESIEGMEDLVIGLEGDENLLRPIVIITSNSEKALPDAFLRRCVYFHLPFPRFNAEQSNAAGTDEVTVERIVDQRLGQRFQGRDDGFVRGALALFRYLRDPQRRLERPPSLAELLNWLDLLLPPEGSEKPAPATPADLGEARLLNSVQLTLLKTQNDQDRAAQLLGEWRRADQA